MSENLREKLRSLSCCNNSKVDNNTDLVLFVRFQLDDCLIVGWINAFVNLLHCKMKDQREERDKVTSQTNQYQ